MFFGVYCVKILFISLSQRLKNSDAVIIALSYGGLFIHQLKRIKHGKQCAGSIAKSNCTLIIKYNALYCVYMAFSPMRCS